MLVEAEGGEWNVYGSIVRCVILAAKLHCLCDIWNSQEKGTARGGEALKYRRQGQHGEGEGGNASLPFLIISRIVAASHQQLKSLDSLSEKYL